MASVWGPGVEQLNRLAVDLGKAGGVVTLAGGWAVQKTAHDVEATAKTFAPVDTGNLRGSIGVDSLRGGLTAVVGPTASYAPYVEFGTAWMAPQAFMGPALDRHGAELVSALGQIASRVL